MKNTWLLLGLAGLLLAGCRKEDEVICTTEITASTGKAAAKAFSQRYAPRLQIFNLNLTSALRYQAVRSAAGAVMDVPFDVFETVTQVPVSGPVQIRFREIYTPGEMLLANLATDNKTTNPQIEGMLESGGQFFIQAWQGNTRLVAPIPSSSFYSLVMRTPMPTPIRGDSSQFHQMSWWKHNIWPDITLDSLGTTPNDTATWRQDYRANVLFYHSGYCSYFSLDTVSYYNIDKPWTPVTVALPPMSIDIQLSTRPAANAYTRVFLVPVQANGLYRPRRSSSNNWRFGQILPGQGFKAVALQWLPEQRVRYAETRVTSGGIVTLSFDPTLTEAQIVQRIRQL